MKRILILLSISAIINTSARSQIATAVNAAEDSIILSGPTHEIINQVASLADYKVKFLGKDELSEKITGIRINDSLMRVLRNLNTFSGTSFAYYLKKDTLFVDDFYTYNIDSGQSRPPFIRTEYDSTRHGQVLVFQNISPVIVMDSLLKIHGRIPINNVQTSETVSGILPLKMVGGYLFVQIMRYHQWVLGNEGKTTTISTVLPNFDDIKGSYRVDSDYFPDSTYTIFTMTKRNNIKTLTFKHIPLQELFGYINRHNKYFVTTTGYWGKGDFVSGTLPLQLPMGVFAKLICFKHNLYHGIYKNNTLIFAKYKDDIEDWPGH